MTWFPLTGKRMEKMPTLGRCCNCLCSGKGKDGKPLVQNINMLGYEAPIPGTGWGCIICKQPPNGAIVVLCDACQEQFEAHAKDLKAPEEGILTVCVGWPDQDVRMPWPAFAKVPFPHDDELHETNVLLPAHTLN